MVSTSYPVDAGDWRGQFIRQLANALARNPSVDLSLWVPPGEHHPKADLTLHDDDAIWLRRLMDDGGIAHLLRRHSIAGTLRSAGLLSRLRRSYARSDAALYHVNWLQNAIALPANGRPALVTALGTDIQLLRLPIVRWLLRRSFSGRSVAICPNAEWMVPVLQRTFRGVARIECVPFGIDADWYRIERPHVTDAPAHWICVTRLTVGKLGPLFQWAEPYFRDSHRELHLIGPHQDGSIVIPDWVRFHGPATPAQLRDTWFPQATGLISLSSHPEGRPQVMLEAMAAGLPILASRLPGHEDIVSHKRTGWICDDPMTFAQGLSFIEATEQNAAMGQRTRQTTRDRFGDWDDCAQRYAAIYTSLATERR